MLAGNYSSSVQLDNSNLCKLYSVQTEHGSSLSFVRNKSKYFRCFRLPIELGNSVIGEADKQSTRKHPPEIATALAGYCVSISTHVSTQVTMVALGMSVNIWFWVSSLTSPCLWTSNMINEKYCFHSRANNHNY